MCDRIDLTKAKSIQLNSPTTCRGHSRMSRWLFVNRPYDVLRTINYFVAKLTLLTLYMLYSWRYYDKHLKKFVPGMTRVGIMRL